MEPAKAALRKLPVPFFSREKRLKYASLLEKHKEAMARTGELPGEIVSEARRDFGERSWRAGRTGFITGAIVGGTLMAPEQVIVTGAMGYGIGKVFAAMERKAKQAIAVLTRFREKRKTKKFSPQQTYAYNLQIIEKRIRQLRS